MRVGLWRGSKHMDAVLMADKTTQRIHGAYAHEIDGDIDNAYEPIVSRIEQFIEQEAPVNAEDRNGISHRELARRITKAGMCFGVDPYMLSAKIFIETRFDRKEDPLLEP